MPGLSETKDGEDHSFKEKYECLLKGEIVMSKRNFEQMNYWAPSQWQKPFTKNQWTLLLVYAAKVGDLEYVMLTLENNADINGIAHISEEDENDGEIFIKFHGMKGKTALHMAADSENAAAIVKLLLDKGSDIYKKSKDKSRCRPELAIFSHIYYGRKEAVELLLNKADELKKSLLEVRQEFSNYTPLMASFYRNPEVVQLLLERKANINARCSGYFGEQSSLIVCMASGNVASLQCLLKWPLFPLDMLDFRDKEGNTALHVAALFQKNPGDINDLDYEHRKKYTNSDIFKSPSDFPESKFPEHFIAPIIQTIILLLEAGAEITAKNYKGESPKVSVQNKIDYLYRQSRIYGDFTCLTPPYLQAAQIDLCKKIIKKLEEWENLQEKSFRMLPLHNLSIFPNELCELISDYDIYPPSAVGWIKTLSLFKTQQTLTTEQRPALPHFPESSTHLVYTQKS